MIKLLLLISLSVALSGCASIQKMSLEDRQRLQTISVNPVVEKAPEMYYLGPGSGFGMMFGAIGGAITAAASIAPGKALREFAERNNIFIDKIVFEEVNNALHQSGKFAIAESATESSAILNISVYVYGFSIPHGFSSNLVPVVSIRCTLVDKSGKTIWRANDRVLPLGNPAEAVSQDDIKKNPRLIEDGWRIASRFIIETMVKGL